MKQTGGVVLRLELNDQAAFAVASASWCLMIAAVVVLFLRGLSL